MHKPSISITKNIEFVKVYSDIKIYTFFLLFCLIGVSIHSYAQTVVPTNRVIYVKPNGTGDGSSWGNATDLNKALIWAQKNKSNTSASWAWSDSNPLQIWVAKGTYVPNYNPADGVGFGQALTGNDRMKYTFLMVSNVQVYGGFKGDEIFVFQRNMGQNETILDGVLPSGSKVYHVVLATGSKNILLDGVTVQNGESATSSTISSVNVNGNGVDFGHGAGFSIQQNTGNGVIVRNSTFTKNKGSVIDLWNSSLWVENSKILENTSSSRVISLDYTSGSNYTTLFKGVLIAANSGAWTKLFEINDSNRRLTLNILNSTIIGDHATLFYDVGTSSATGKYFIRNSVLWSNLNNNITSVFNQNNSLYTIVSSLIRGRTVTTAGNISSTGLIVSNLFVDPAAFDFRVKAGSVLIDKGSNTLYASVGTNNQYDLALSKRINNGDVDIGAYEYQCGTLPPVAPSLQVLDPGSTVANLAATGQNIKWYDGLFTDVVLPNNTPILEKDYYVSSLVSGCESSRTKVRVIFGMKPNMRVIYVNKHVDVNDPAYLGDGSSWANAVVELSDALRWADNNQGNTGQPWSWNTAVPLQIWVAKGTYQPLYTSATGQNFKDSLALVQTGQDPRDRAFKMVSNVQVYGEFSANETAVTQRSLPTDGDFKTILSGDFKNDDVVVGSGVTLSIANSSDNAANVVWTVGSTGVRLDGFTIQGGANNANLPTISVNGQSFARQYGAGLRTYNSSGILRNIQLRYNMADQGGAGLFSAANKGTHVISAQSIYVRNNFARTFAGGIYTEMIAMDMEKSVFEGNKGGNGGGGLYFTADKLILNRCRFINNVVVATDGTLGSGAGLQFSDGATEAVVRNSLFYNNRAGGSNDDGGGAVMIYHGSVKLINNTFYNNQSGSVGKPASKAVSTMSGTNAKMYNNIIYGDTDGQVHAEGALTATNNIIRQSTQIAGANNRNLNPQFKDVSIGDFTLADGSVATNVGDNMQYEQWDENAFNSNLNLDVDLADSPRLYGVKIDLGAFESQSPVQVIYATDITKTYGDADFELTASSSSGYAVTYTSGNTSIAEMYQDVLDGNKWKVKIKGVGTVQIEVSQTGGNGYSPVTDHFTLTVIPKGLTVTADSETKVYGSVDPALTYTVNGLVSGDVAANVFTGQLSRTVGETVGSYLVRQGGLTVNSNYTFTFTGNTFAITPKSLTVTADPLTKVYGSVDPALTYTVNGLVSGDVATDVFTGQLSRTVGESVESYLVTQGGLTVNSNYTFTFTGNTFAITPKGLTVMADPLTKVYGSVDPALTYTVNGLVSGDVATDVFTGQLSRTVGESVGSYLVTQGGLTVNSNYTFTFTGNTFAITPKGLTVMADPLTKVYGSVDPALTYTVNGLVSGDVATDVFTGQLSRTVGENVGSYLVTQGGLTVNSNYTFTFTDNTFRITPKSLVVTASPHGKTYGSTDPVLTYSLDGLVAGDIVASVMSGTLTRDMGQNVGSYIIRRGTLVADNNYVMTFNNNVFVIVPKTLRIDVGPQTKIYGEDDPVLTYSLNGLAVGDNADWVLSGSLVRDSGEQVGGYVVRQGTLVSNANYSIVYTGSLLHITPAPLTVTADVKVKKYGNNDPILTYEVVGLQYADSSSDVFFGVLARDPGENVGDYAVRIGTLQVNPNYTIDSFALSVLTITKSRLTVKAKNTAKIMDFVPFIAGVGVEFYGFKFSDSEVDLSGDLVYGGTSQGAIYVGSYTIDVSGWSSDNYDVVFEPGELTIYVGDIFVPNVITPNGDGLNDVLIVKESNNLDQVGLVIFNVEGFEVFRTSDYKDTFNGRGLNKGTYFYRIDYADPKDPSRLKVKKGYITIM